MVFDCQLSGIAALSSVFANTGYLGIPLFLTAFGPDQAGPAIVATVTVNIVFVGGTICFLELAGINKATPAVTMINVFRALAKNLLISAPVLALPFTIIGTSLSRHNLPVYRKGNGCHCISPRFGDQRLTS